MFSTKQNITAQRYIIISVLKIIGFVLIGSIMVYGLNTQFSRSIYFIFILLYFFLTKDNTIGIALLFILILNPWGLFFYRPYEWLIPLTSTVGVNYKMFFILVIVAKLISLKYRKHIYIKDYFRKYYKPIIFYFIFLIIWGLAFGHSAESLYNLLFSLSVLLLFISLPRALDYYNLLKFNKIIFLFCLIHTFVSFIDILSLGKITNLLIFGREAPTAAVWDRELVRLTGGIGIALYCMITGLYYLTSKEITFKSWYLLLVMLTSLFYILNSATRGWMLASLFLLLVYFLFYFRRIFSGKKLITSTLVLLFFGFFTLPNPIRENIESAFTRLETVESIAEGDLSAGGTTGRWVERGPKVLSRFQESPIFGFGFSKVSSEYYDGHVGNHCLLLMGGIVGLLLIWGTVLLIITFLFRLERRTKFYKGIFVFGIAFMAIMIIHSTSRVMISFRMPIDTAFLISLLFNHVNSKIDLIKYRTHYYVKEF